MKNYVIIGNGIAAAGCIEGIRSADRDGKITVVSAENHPVYCRPLISYYLENKTDVNKMKYRSDGFYAENGCEVIYGVHAVSIDSAAKTVKLDNGDELPFDRLCTATGSSPFIPPFAGLEKVKRKFEFMTLDDALALEEAVSKESRVLIIGAGLIGLKCAEGLYGRAKSITVCDLANRVLSSILDEESSEVVKRRFEEKGISFMLGDSAEAFEKSSAKMKSGKIVDFDILVLAVGVRANISIFKSIGGKCNRGIVVNERCETSVSDIYAAGDCTEYKDVSDGTEKVMALLPNAYMQGHCAGVNMAGGAEVFDNAVPMNSIGFFGLHTMTAGSREGEVYEDISEMHLKKLFINNDRLVGFILIGDTARAGIYTDMIRKRTPLESVDFDILKKTPELFAFSEKYRRKILGGVV